MYRIPEWSSFQSYKDRSPPWIRLHKRLLDNYKFHSMTAEARALLPMLWLIASEDENPVTGLLRIGYEEIAFRLRMDKKIVKTTISELVACGFLIDETEQKNETETTSYETVTKTLRNCHSETETETETEYTPARGKKITKPDDVSDQTWKDFTEHRKAKRAKVTQTALDGIRREADKAGWLMDDALKEICVRGWQGFKSDWVESRSSEAEKRQTWEWVEAPPGYSSVNMVTQNGKNWIKRPKHAKAN